MQPRKMSGVCNQWVHIQDSIAEQLQAPAV